MTVAPAFEDTCIAGMKLAVESVDWGWLEVFACNTELRGGQAIRIDSSQQSSDNASL